MAHADIERVKAEALAALGEIDAMGALDAGFWDLRSQELTTLAVESVVRRPSGVDAMDGEIAISAATPRKGYSRSCAFT